MKGEMASDCECDDDESMNDDSEIVVPQEAKDENFERPFPYKKGAKCMFFLGDIDDNLICKIQEKLDSIAHAKFVQSNSFMVEICCKSLKWPLIVRNYLKIDSTYFMSLPQSKSNPRGANIIQQARGDYHQLMDRKDIQRIRFYVVHIDDPHLCDFPIICQYLSSANMIGTKSLVICAPLASDLDFLQEKFHFEFVEITNLRTNSILPLMNVPDVKILSCQSAVQGDFLYRWVSRDCDLMLLELYNREAYLLKDILQILNAELLWSKDSHEMTIIGHLNIHHIINDHMEFYKLVDDTSTRFAYIQFEATYLLVFRVVRKDFDYFKDIIETLNIRKN